MKTPEEERVRGYSSREEELLHREVVRLQTRIRHDEQDLEALKRKTQLFTNILINKYGWKGLGTPVIYDDGHTKVTARAPRRVEGEGYCAVICPVCEQAVEHTAYCCWQGAVREGEAVPRQDETKPWWTGKDVVGWLMHRGWTIQENGLTREEFIIPATDIINSRRVPDEDGPLFEQLARWNGDKHYFDEDGKCVCCGVESSRETIGHDCPKGKV